LGVVALLKFQRLFFESSFNRFRVHAPENESALLETQAKPESATPLPP
jgi:hypothetical protein